MAINHSLLDVNKNSNTDNAPYNYYSNSNYNQKRIINTTYSDYRMHKNEENQNTISSTVTIPNENTSDSNTVNKKSYENFNINDYYSEEELIKMYEELPDGPKKLFYNYADFREYLEYSLNKDLSKK